jgi:protein involved in polysaccharide export with SLBB domain
MRSLSLFFLACAVLTGCRTPPPVPAPTRAQRATGAAGAVVRVGDRILLSVEGEKALTDSFTVTVGPSLELPLVGIIALVGVRRVDLEPLLTKAIGRYVKNPVVRVRIQPETMRLAVLGDIAKPGFYELPREAVVADVFTKAGGPTPTSKLNKSRIERSDTTLIGADSLRKALDAGVTLGELGVQSGDRLMVPASGGFMRTLSVVGAIIAIPLTIMYLTSYRR